MIQLWKNIEQSMSTHNRKFEIPNILSPSVKVFNGGLFHSSYSKQDIQVSNVDAEIRFRDSSFSSINLPEVKFSNMLPDEKLMIEPNVRGAIEQLLSHPELVNKNSKEIYITYKNRDRLKKIISCYLPDEEYCSVEEDFRKSDIIDNDIVLVGRGSFRVITVYSVEIDEYNVPKQYLTIILLDPYHLFLPSNHRNKSKGEIIEDTYGKVGKFGSHISKYFNFN